MFVPTPTTPTTIRFPCRCGNVIEAPVSLAGDSTQCPQCGRLRSVPTLEELPDLEDDGTFRLDEESAPKVVARPAAPAGPPTLEYAGPSTPARPVPSSRPEYRPDPSPAARRDDPDLLAFRDGPDGKVETSPQPAAPRDEADSLTFRDGPDDDDETAAPHAEFSRVVPKPLKPEPATVEQLAEEKPKPAAPAAPTLNYAGLGTRAASGYAPAALKPLDIRPVTWYGIPLALFQPANIFVLGIIFVLHVAAQVAGLIFAAGGFPLIVIVVLIWLVILAHYGATVQETGPEAHDELPPVLRNVNFGEDFFAPLAGLFGSAALCFAPAVGVLIANARYGLGDGPAVVAAVLAVTLGVIAFPAVWLTVATSGSLHNLLPHRVLGVAVKSGVKYPAAVVLLVLTLLCYGVGTFLTDVIGLIVYTVIGFFVPNMPEIPAFLTTQVLGVVTVAGLIGYPALVAGIYFAHAFAWLLGKMYQRHHDEFPWVLQRHVSTRDDATKRLERAKAAQLRAEAEERAKRASEQVRTRVASR